MRRHSKGNGWRITWAWMAAAAIACPALGQVQSRESGRALDANPQVGSGGVNRPGQVIDYAVRNAVITGNVPDGREFRGDVGYSAPTEFRGGVASDDLFRFNARSLGSSLPYVASGGGNYGVDPSGVVVPRSTGAATYYSTTELIVPNRMIGPTGGTYSAAQIASGTARITIPDTTAVAVREAPDGRLLEISTTALLGVREVERPRLLRDVDELTDLSQREQYRLQVEVKPETPDEAQPLKPTSTEPLNQQLEGQQLGTMVDPGLTLGQQLTASRMGADARTFDQQVGDIERAMFRQLGSRNANPGDDVYLDVLRAMRGDAQLPKAVTQDATKEPEQLEAPSIEELEKAEQARRRAVEAAAAALAEQAGREQPQGTPTPGPGPATQPDPMAQPGQEQQPDEAPASDPTRPGSLGGLLDTIEGAQDLPRLVTLAGEREDRINRLLRDAETDLAAGHFFDAESKYRQVLADAPQTPLAMAGQAHAQLGAGMIKSGAYTLRRLFEQHPELIGVRYDARLLPPKKRLDYIHGQIMQELRDAPRGETALALAYLGYQTNSTQITRYGLTIAETRSPQDPLLPLLRRIWLSEKPANAGQGK